MSVFFKRTRGFEHQFDMPDVPGPKKLKSEEIKRSMMDQITEITEMDS